ncbi:MAG: PorV/PorQ family protein [Elusimicrobiota bacterium]
MSGRTAARGALLIAAALSAFAPPALAGFGETDVGTSGAQFLQLGGGARAQGMAGAYTALPAEADAIYWNPAALSRIETHSATLMSSVLPAGINYEFLGYGQRLSPSFSAGGSVQYLSQPPIDQTDSSGFATGGTFRPSDFAAALGGAYTIHNEDFGVFDGASFGGEAKYVSDTITKTAHTFGFDAGFLSAPFRVWGHEMRLAYDASNIGGSIKFQQLSDELPTILRFGTSLALTKTWLLDLDLDEPLNNAPFVAIGTEYRIAYNSAASFSVRGGLSTRALGDAGNFSGATLGLGARFSRLGIDYAFAPMGALGMTNTFSVSFAF